MPSKLITLLLLFTSLYARAQTGTVKGRVSDVEGIPISYAYIINSDSVYKTVAGRDGKFELELPIGTHIIDFYSFGYNRVQKEVEIVENTSAHLEIKLSLESAIAKEIKLSIDYRDDNREEVSIIKLKKANIKRAGLVSDDISQIIATLPGVTVNSELSSQYSVRGGSFDENLVYVNDIQVYRPFLTRAGRQEGLSFVNSDLVEDVSFYGGGWQPRYGDKMSSVLAIEYREPDTLEGSLTAGLLGGSIHLGGASKSKRFTYIIGARQKSTQYLLNSLETQGEYLPKFLDLQTYFTFDMTKYDKGWKKELGSRTKLSVLGAFARNRYLVRPAARRTNFGTNDNVVSLFIAFDGQESLSYNTTQESVKLMHRFSKNHKAEFFGSFMTTREREFQDLEGGYRLCDINPVTGGNAFNECEFERGVGTLYDYSRNTLSASITTTGYRGYFSTSDSAKNNWEWGANLTNQKVEDHIAEYSFIDSSDYVSITHVLSNKNSLNTNRIQGYLQNSTWLSDSSKLSYGVRLNYFQLNGQLLVSPRIQYSWVPKNTDKDVVYKAALGIYSQPPFYRELRGFDGIVNRNLKAQSSIHAILGRDHNFEMWERKFKFTSEVYYKHLSNIVPYDIDNVRLRYYADNNANGYVYGADFRVGGEFVKGEESWFSLGILSTREDIQGDNRGYIRRPTDQRINFGVFFQDHLPKNPSLKMNLNLVFGTGLPFGPPNSAEYRNSFSAPAYKRLDVGFSKLITFRDQEIKKSKYLKSMYLALEVLNIIGAQNTISYIWIADVTGAEFAVPNTLSARFVNLKLIIDF